MLSLAFALDAVSHLLATLRIHLRFLVGVKVWDDLLGSRDSVNVIPTCKEAKLPELLNQSRHNCIGRA